MKEVEEKTNNKKITITQCNSMLNAINDALYVIGGKWKLRIIVGLLDRDKRFNELQRTVEGISAKVLSNELNKLELNGFVERRIHSDSYPVIVEYCATDYAYTLEEVLGSLSKWGEKHREKIKASMRNH